jgi:catechol 2,3-dioxygenase-like lactoylglutathione lyase family enzyme
MTGKDGNLSQIDHVALVVDDIAGAIAWYSQRFKCQVIYQDPSWAMLAFANIKLALVLPGQHPPHLGFLSPEAGKLGNLTRHRDGTRSIYISDPSGNAIEIQEGDESAERVLCV